MIKMNYHSKSLTRRPFSLASSMSIEMSVSWSTTLVQTGISQQLLDVLSKQLVPTLVSFDIYILHHQIKILDLSNI